MKLNFQKMHGCGNDFVIIDARGNPVELSSKQVKQLADRRLGIGCDQLVVIENAKTKETRSVGRASPEPVPSRSSVERSGEQPNIFMHIYNADGGKVSTCGNATRCVGELLMRETGTDQATIETEAGVLKAWRDTRTDVDGAVCVSMGRPRLSWQEIPLSESRNTLHLGLEEGVLMNPAAVSMGNPHMVFFVKNLDLVQMAKSGPKLERHELFPQGVNVSAVQILAQGRLKVIVHERGAGQTLACGSAACAVVVAGVLRGVCKPKADVEMPGGVLHIDWRKDTEGDVLMSGAVAYAFKGEIEL